MSLRDGLLKLARKHAKQSFRDRVLITRVVGTKWNEETLRNEPEVRTVYEGAASLESPYRAPTVENGPGQSQNVELAQLKLPVIDSVGIEAGDKVTFLTSASDPDLIGREFTVAVGSQQSDTSARRIPVKEFS